MIGLLQRVSAARVKVAGDSIGTIGQGLLVLVGVQRGDDEHKADRLLERLLSYRVFPDSEGRMGRSLRDIDGGLLLVPQFTLAADTERGRRPSFTSAADPQTGQQLFDEMKQLAAQLPASVSYGEFGADMQVFLQNDGPVTFILKQ